MIRVLIADDHRLFRKGIINIMKEYDEIKVVGEAENGPELIEKYSELRPDVIVVDISMPNMTGIEAVEEILKIDSDAKSLFLTMYEGEEYVYQVYRSGGKGLVSKNSLEDELLGILRYISEGNYYFGENYSLDSIDSLQEKYNAKKNIVNIEQYNQLSNREKEVFGMIGEGLSSNEISTMLFISKRTVDHHREKIKEKLGAKSFHEVFRLAVENKMQN